MGPSGHRGWGWDHKWRAFAAIGVAFVTNVFASTMVFVALPSIAEDFGVSLRSVAWVVITQSLTISAVMLPMGRVADMIGRRRVHLLGLTVFGLSSIGVAVAPTFGWLLVARVVMSVGSAMGQSVGTAMAVAVFPPEERGKAIGSQTTAVAVGAASGPVVGGLVLQVLPWEALFLLLVIPVSIALIAGFRVLDEAMVTPAQGPRPPFDWLGATLSAALVTVLVLTLNNPLALPWGSPTIIGGVAGVAGLGLLFVWWELKTSVPMLDLRLFARSRFTTAVGARIIGFMGATVSTFLAPVYLISLRGMSAASAGGVMLLSSAGMAVSAQGSGRLSDRYGTRPFALVGFLILTVVALAYATMTRSTPLPLVMVVMLVNGLSLGLWNVPTNAAVMGSVGADQHGVVGAFTNLARNLGNVVGQALASAVVVGVMVARGFDIPLDEIGSSTGAGDAFTAGWRLAFLAVMPLALAGLVLVAVGLESGRPLSSDRGGGRPGRPDRERPDRAQGRLEGRPRS